MNRNFIVGQGNELVLEGRIFDLHNCYDFSGIAIASTSCAQLWFKPNPEHSSNISPLVLEVHGLSVLELSSGVVLGTVRDLDEVGYKNPGDGDLDWLMSERTATGEDHLVFRFGPSDHIRIHGACAQLREQQDSCCCLFFSTREVGRLGDVPRKFKLLKKGQ
jgi:hypothetical protein